MHSFTYTSEVIDDVVTKARDFRPQLEIAYHIKAFLPNLSIGIFLNFEATHPRL